MKVKTSTLIGPGHNWAVANCLGWTYTALGRLEEIPKFSEWWAQGGPIIEREKISVYHMDWLNGDQKWMAGEQYGPTPLIAAMRAYVASKLGDEIEIPEELK